MIANPKSRALVVLILCTGVLLSGCKEEEKDGPPSIPPAKTATELMEMPPKERRAWEQALRRAFNAPRQEMSPEEREAWKQELIERKQAKSAAEWEEEWAAMTQIGWFTTEIRITVEWKGEVADAVGVDRCKVYKSSASKFAIGISDHYARDRFRCGASRVAMVEFSDGTQFGFSYWMDPRKFRGIKSAVEKGRPFVKNADGKDSQGRPRRIWFDPDLDIPAPTKFTHSGIASWSQHRKWVAVSLGVKVGKSHDNASDVTLSIPNYPGFKEGNDGPRILRVVTTRISDDTAPTKAPEKFETFFD